MCCSRCLCFSHFLTPPFHLLQKRGLVRRLEQVIIMDSDPNWMKFRVVPNELLVFFREICVCNKVSDCPFSQNGINTLIMYVHLGIILLSEQITAIALHRYTYYCTPDYKTTTISLLLCCILSKSTRCTQLR